VAGALTLAAVSARYASGMAQADAARRAWNDEQARRAIADARAGTAHRWSADQAAVGAPVARLVIPRLDLDEIVLEGVGGEELNAGPGHVPGSALPGSVGNAIISAHRDRHFRHFDALRVGDTLRTETGDATTTWIVVATRVIDRDAPALFQTRTATLTLTTCWPIRYFGSAPERLIVTAKPIAG
jgi:sortase A